MGSFKLKLVVYFLLLAFVPLAAGYWGFSSIAASSQTRQVDARLQSSLRAGLAAYQVVLAAASARADRLARQPDFARALAHRDRAALARMLRNAPGLRVVAPGLKLGAARHGQVPGKRALGAVEDTRKGQRGRDRPAEQGGNQQLSGENPHANPPFGRY